MTAPYGAKFVPAPSNADSTDRRCRVTMTVDVAAQTGPTGKRAPAVLYADGRVVR